jgi:hypothetical protein
LNDIVPIKENKASMYRFLEEANKHNVDKIDELEAPDFIDYTNNVEGAENLIQFGRLVG